MSSSPFARNLKPPYYAVIFTAQRAQDDRGYEGAAERMQELAAQHAGYLGVESVGDAGGLEITVSYWQSIEAIAAWKANAEHLVAQETGKSRWYEHYELGIAKVERAYAKKL